MHEYRKQQVTPSPPVAVGQRSLKRRRGAPSGLNEIERISGPTDNTTSRLNSLLADPPTTHTRSSRLFPFTTRLDNSPTSSLRSAQYFSQTQSLLNSSVPTTAVESSKLRSFKSIKHLPRRESQHPQRVFATVSFAPSSSSSPALEARPATSSPTISLSRFPNPPGLGSPSPSALASEWMPPQQQDDTAPRPPTPPRSAPPTVLHYRGASFDLVNPHNSLQERDIHTPAGRDSDSPADYFDPTANVLATLTADMSSRDRADTVVSDDSGTPQRALYDDFETAHEFITTRSNRSTPRSKRSDRTGISVSQLCQI
jgi:hypothetical protein